MKPREKAALITKLDNLPRGRMRKLKTLGIPVATYYRWKKRYAASGIKGLVRRGGMGRVWNRLIPEERDRILTIARLHPDLSCRLIAVKITDEEDFSVSESTVYRLLKKHGLIAPRPITDLPAKKQWQHRTKTVDEIWQCDATHYFVVGWGYYKMITVQDDHSRYPLAWDLKPDETAFSISDVIEQAIEHAKKQEHLEDDQKPKLLSDNGSGFTSKVMAGYLKAHGIKHIFGRPYHPQTQGKIERFHRSIKEKVCLLVYCAPDELKKAIDEAITTYAQTPHKALTNVSPKDVYAGKKEEILQKRKEKKRLTLARRRKYNMQRRKGRK